MTDTSTTAACRCGTIRVRCGSAPVLQLVCHCSDCRAAAGTPFTNFVFFRARDTEVTGTPRRVAFTAASGHATVRELCPACGEMVLDRTDGFPKVVGVVAERLAAPFIFTPQHHVWAASRLPGVALPTDLPVYPGSAP